jgi:hypothetical protein
VAGSGEFLRGQAQGSAVHLLDASGVTGVEQVDDAMDKSALASVAAGSLILAMRYRGTRLARPG